MSVTWTFDGAGANAMRRALKSLFSEDEGEGAGRRGESPEMAEECLSTGLAEAPAQA